MVGISGCSSLENSGIVFGGQTLIGDTDKKFEAYLATLSSEALQGNVQSQFALGRMYLTGSITQEQKNELANKYQISPDDTVNVEQNYNKAESWFKIAAKNNHIEAGTMLAMMYFEQRIEHPELYKKGLEWAFWAFNQQSDLAAILIGMAYIDGVGVKKDYNQAFKYFSKANLNNIDHELPEYKVILDSFYNLGEMFWLGNSVKKDATKAVQLLEKLDEQNYMPATGVLAQIYQKGQGVSKDLRKALKYGLRVEEAGVSEFSIENGYILGLNPEILKQTPVHYVERVKSDLHNLLTTDTDNSRAAFALYKLALQTQDDNITLPDLMRLLIKAAASVSEAKAELDEVYRVLKRKELEANRGNAKTMLGLAYFYSLTGHDGEPEPVKAVSFARKAADCGEPQALMLLARFYGEGIVLVQDRRKALELIRQAADMGLPEAVNWMRAYNQALAELRSYPQEQLLENETDNQVYQDVMYNLFSSALYMMAKIAIIKMLNM